MLVGLDSFASSKLVCSLAIEAGALFFLGILNSNSPTWNSGTRFFPSVAFGVYRAIFCWYDSGLEQEYASELATRMSVLNFNVLFIITP